MHAQIYTRFHPQWAARSKGTFKVVTQDHTVGTPNIRRELKGHRKLNLRLQPCPQTGLSLVLQTEAAERPTTRNYFYFSK